MWAKAKMTSAAQNTAKAWPAVEDQTLQIRVDLAAAYRLIHRLGLDERSRLVADLGDKFVMVLRNHGMLTCGRSVAEAFKLMHNLERSCRAQLAVQSSGAEIIELSAAVARKTAGQYASFYDAIETNGVPDSEWAAFKRMLERTDPDFAN